jgi:hypothetical protein
MPENRLSIYVTFSLKRASVSSYLSKKLDTKRNLDLDLVSLLVLPIATAPEELEIVDDLATALALCPALGLNAISFP